MNQRPNYAPDIAGLKKNIARPKRAVVTGGMPYANGPVHMGHLAGALIPPDIHARYLRMLIGDENVLFVCDGAEGLKVFDKTDLFTLDQHMIDQFSGIVANDVIPMGNTLLMTSTSGIYQYDCTDLRNISQLSLIPVQQ